MTRLLLLSALLLLPAGAGAQAATATVLPPPDSVVHAVLAAIEAGTPAARAELIATRLSDQARTRDSARLDALLATLHADGAPWTLGRISHYGRSAFVELASAGAARALTLQVGTDRAAPPALGTIDMLESHHAVLDELAWPSGAGLADSALARVIGENVQRAAAGDAFSGVVYVLSRDTVLYAQAVGMADRAQGVPLTLDTRFAMASMTKMLTAVGVFRLVERGLLRLDDTLGRVLPEYPNADRAARVTIRHLLDHSAGMGSQWGTPRRPVQGLTGALATAAAVAHPPLLFEPGSRFSYSNEGYTVLAAIIERISGMPYAEYIEREILVPTGMTRTLLVNTASAADRAIGYYPLDDDVLRLRPFQPNVARFSTHDGGGAGGGLSTAADLAKLARALREERLLSRATLYSMWTGRWDIPGFAGQRYGYGSFVQRVGDVLAAGHGGGGLGSGIDTGFRYFTDGSYTLVVLTNIDPPAATRFTTAITQLLGEAASGRRPGGTGAIH